MPASIRLADRHNVVHRGQQTGDDIARWAELRLIDSQGREPDLVPRATRNAERHLARLPTSTMLADRTACPASDRYVTQGAARIAVGRRQSPLAETAT
jgi:hypothetical protein